MGSDHTPDGAGMLQPKSYSGAVVLLVLGVVLTLFLLVNLVVDLPFGVFVTSVALSPWGPICLIVAALVARHVSKVNRLVHSGITATATVRSVQPTASRINGRPVLRIGMSVHVDEVPAYPVTIRNAPQFHHIYLLRIGASIPVVVDPDNPEQVLIDWNTADSEASS